MNADSTYWIGKDHTICEDYSLSGVNSNLAYAIVCDGCSSSEDVDVGARALAMSAKRTLLFGPEHTAEKFGEITIQNAQRVFDIFPYLHPQALYATLLVAWVQEKKFTVYAYGDGVIVHKLNDRTRATHIEITSGPPDYLSYYLDKNRLDSYKKIEKNEKSIYWAIDGNIDMYHPSALLKPYSYTMDVEEGDIVAVISYGINSFRKADNTPIDWSQLVSEFVGFKNFEGQFVLRRIAAFKRKCLKEGITHSDDISIAAIVV
jgi:hypothetical protein